MGRYEGTVAEQYVPYALPQEHGNKVGLRWLSLSGQLAPGWLALAGDTLLSGGASIYSQEVLTAARHPYDLEAADYISLHLDYQQMGLGGDDSWSPRVHPEFQLQAPHYRYDYWLRPLPAGQLPETMLPGEKGLPRVDE